MPGTPHQSVRTEEAFQMRCETSFVAFFSLVVNFYEVFHVFIPSFGGNTTVLQHHALEKNANREQVFCERFCFADLI